VTYSGADMSKPAAIAGMVADAIRDHGKVDILVNNAGIQFVAPIDEFPEAKWDAILAINLSSAFHATKAVLPGMKQRNHGRIVFISSESGICPPGEMVHYGMTKSAQLSVSRGIAETCAGTGVTVNSVLPGPTLTEGAKDFLDKLAKEQGKSFDELVEWFFANARPTSLLRRFIEPKEVAAMVAYVCSPLSAATNGAALRVDGGVVRSLI